MVHVNALILMPLLIALIGLDVYVTVGIVGSVRERLQKRTPPLSTYTWLEDDIPEYLPTVGSGPTWLTQSIEESVRYGLHEPEAPDEWLYTVMVAEGGNVRVGPNHRLAIPSFAHQHHCLRVLRALLDELDGIPDGHILPHAEHCLSILRQHTLCAADTTLEPGDTFSRNFTSQRVSAERKCVNMEPYYEAVRSSRMEWVALRRNNASTSM